MAVIWNTGQPLRGYLHGTPLDGTLESVGRGARLRRHPRSCCVVGPSGTTHVSFFALTPGRCSDAITNESQSSRYGVQPWCASVEARRGQKATLWGRSHAPRDTDDFLQSRMARRLRMRRIPAIQFDRQHSSQALLEFESILPPKEEQPCRKNTFRFPSPSWRYVY
jgi:hypothetical protein